jgi:hypothetical protein
MFKKEKKGKKGGGQHLKKKKKREQHRVLSTSTCDSKHLFEIKTIKPYRLSLNLPQKGNLG